MSELMCCECDEYFDLELAEQVCPDCEAKQLQREVSASRKIEMLIAENKKIRVALYTIAIDSKTLDEAKDVALEALDTENTKKRDLENKSDIE